MIATPDDVTQTYLTAIEEELQLALKQADGKMVNQLYKMLSYHMGWNDKSDNSNVRGKRIRPLLTLLACTSARGNWKDALPAAVAVEMVHNFSLIHDDIEDHSPLRRGRPTVWKKWGVAQALNAGDAMFTLAHLQPIRLHKTISPTATLRAVDLLQHACLHLTQGQYLDLAFEKRDQVSIDEYWSMVEGKTAALISASTELGAICASADEQTCVYFRRFGRLFGLAFQVLDDLLGIWGNSAFTGKPDQSDLYAGKKTLPVLYGLSRGGKFYHRWLRKPFQSNDIDEMVKLLEDEGGKEFTITTANELINQAIIVLDEAHPSGDTVQILRELTTGLIYRQS